MTMFATITAAPAVAALPIHETDIVGRAAWDQAFAAWQCAEAELAAHDAAFRPLDDACFAETEAVPHTTLEPDPYTGKTYAVGTANLMDVGEARYAIRGRYSIDPQYPSVAAHYALMERLVAAADARDAEVQRIRQRYGWHEANDRSEALAEAFCDAESVLLELPAPDIAALAWKLERMFGDAEPDGYCDSLTARWTHQLIADARRLDGRA